MEKKKLSLNEQAQEILAIAEKHGVEQNFFFLTTFKRYQVQISILNELEKKIKEQGSLVTKEYVKGRENVYTQPAIGEYNKTATAANQTTSSGDWSSSSSDTRYKYMNPWVYHFVGAIRGYYPSVSTAPYYDTDSCYADSNGDGRVSFREAGLYAKAKIDSDYYFPEYPQYDESSSGLGNSFFMSKYGTWPGPTLPTALDNTSVSFTTGGSASWFPQTDTSHDGVDAARSGLISDNQSSWMKATVSGSGTFSFWWRVSSEGNYDFLTLYVDGYRSRRISGSTSWAQVTLALTGSGTHTVQWTYSKDYSYSYNSDCGWVDQGTWGSGATLAPVYRFYSRNFKGHFFTISENEKCKIDRSDSNWAYEMVAYRAYTRRVSGTVPLYRFYSSKFRGHFYTRSENEKNKVMRDRNWRYEGVAYYVYPSAVSGARPVYRFWSKNFRHHFYTMSESEMWRIRNTDRNWKYEMVAFYAMPNSSSSSFSAASRGTGAEASATAGLSAFVPDADGVAVAPGVRLETRPSGLLVEAGETLDLGGLMLEARADEPADFVAGTPAPLGDAAPGLRLSLPGGALSPALWSAADGTLIEGEAVEGAFDFTLPASDVWHRLFIRDGGDREVWSLWLRALSGE